MSLLGPLKGARPDAPSWFVAAMAQAPERLFVPVEGADIEVLTWGRRGDPGLLLLHGFAAHADWWSFIAPLLAQGRRVAAMSWSGMGLSGWRDSYSLPQHAREAMAAADAAGLFEGPTRPLVVGHSYGSYVSLWMASHHGERLGAVVAADGPLSDESGGGRPSSLPSTPGVHRIYPTLEAALARFRFTPPQSCDNLFIVDHIARNSLRSAIGADGAAGWSWRFDPQLRPKMQVGDRSGLLAALQRPVALMVGERSKLMTPERLQFMRKAAASAPWVEIPDAGHHLMADQPLALVAALNGLFAGWPRDNP